MAGTAVIGGTLVMAGVGTVGDLGSASGGGPIGAMAIHGATPIPTDTPPCGMGLIIPIIRIIFRMVTYIPIGPVTSTLPGQVLCRNRAKTIRKNLQQHLRHKAART